MSQAESIERIRKLLPPQGQVIFDNFVVNHVMPEMPDGWRLDKIQEFRGSFCVSICKYNQCKNIMGDTIFDAIKNAIWSINNDARS